MMTYEEYQAAIIVNIEAQRETRRQNNEEQRQLQEEMNARFDDAKRRYREECAMLYNMQRERAQAISQKWKAERVRLFTEHAKVVDQWRKEHGISTPPFVELPAGERPNDEGGAEL
ncbi:MAG: hypothetical protein J5486_04260 [Bacteroidaceae bacterium]|nr:hypothetical protein [Bacteroidaceae bacterium]